MTAPHMPSRKGRSRHAFAGLGATMALAATCLVGCTPSLDWRTIQLPAVGATLLLPCKPSVFARQLTLASEVVTWTLHSCRAAERNWAVAYTSLTSPDAARRALGELREVREELQASSDAEQRPLPWRVARAGEFSRATHWQRKARLSGRTVLMDMALAQRAHQLVQLLAVGERPDDEAVGFFLDSLRVQAAP